MENAAVPALHKIEWRADHIALAVIQNRLRHRHVSAGQRRAVTALFFVNGALFATWVSRIPAIESLRDLNHATFGLALLIVALGALISMPITGAVSARIGTGQIWRFASGPIRILPFQGPHSASIARMRGSPPLREKVCANSQGD